MGLKKAEQGSAKEKLNALSAFLAEWKALLGRHFLEEEQLLPRLMTDQEHAKLVEDHDALRQHVQDAECQIDQGVPEEGFCESVGTRLERHIRWEERELFKAIEQRATDEQLAELASETGRIENERSR